MRATARKAGRPSIEAVTLPAPTGGINRVDPAGSLPKRDCIYLYNMVPAEYGCRSRLGSKEHATGLLGPDDTAARVPSLHGFSGSQKNGSADKLFGMTAAGIWDVTASTASPTKPVTFSVQSGDAGEGISCAVVNDAGQHHLLYTDEENGLYFYSETSGEWTKVVAGATVPWEPNVAYSVGDRVTNAGNVYECDSPGISDVSGGPTGTAADIDDGGARWDYVSAVVANAIGPSLGDARNGFSLDPSNFAFVTVWKSRVFLVEKDSSAFWYGDVNAFLGTFNRFDVGLKMPHGGPLAGLFSWSYDAGNGLETLLVCIGSSGDIVIYQGTDPSSIDTFGLKGVWFVGGIPAGRRIATDYGGDVLVLSILGVVPLSRLIAGQAKEASSQYATYKVQPLFNLLVSTLRSLRGWGLCVHPTDNVLLVTVPTAAGAPTVQLAMALSGEKGWGQYRDLPMLSACVWNGQLYFGTTDGRVCINEGYVDGVTLADPNSFEPVRYSLLLGYRNLGNARQKRVHMLRPNILSETPDAQVEATALFGFDLLEPPPPTGANSGLTNTWGAATWDSSVWGGDYTASQPLQGASGMGREVAVAVRGSAKSRTILTGIEVWFDQGGVL